LLRRICPLHFVMLVWSHVELIVKNHEDSIVNGSNQDKSNKPLFESNLSECMALIHGVLSFLGKTR
jgi:hypothetical protein